MVKFLKKIFFLLYFSTLLVNCSHSGQFLDKDAAFTNPGRIVVWALADIQPVDNEDKKTFENAIEDVNENIKGVDLAIVAGDIVENTNSADFDWYIDTRSKSYIKQFYEIAGNHDLKPDRGKLFKEKLRKDFHYTVAKGNLLFIFLSDEERGKSTSISDSTFNWWKKQVVENQDKIIVVVSHAPLEGSGISFSSLDGRKIKNSSRFTEVLRHYNIDIWLSGHLHLPHAFNNVITKPEELNKASFVHISSIRKELLGIKHSESRFLSFYCDSDKVVIHSRDHDRNEWLHELETELRLSKKIEC